MRSPNVITRTARAGAGLFLGLSLLAAALPSDVGAAGGNPGRSSVKASQEFGRAC